LPCSMSSRAESSVGRLGQPADLRKAATVIFGRSNSGSSVILSSRVTRGESRLRENRFLYLAEA
jgi:hypothetical protein